MMQWKLELTEEEIEELFRMCPLEDDNFPPPPEGEQDSVTLAE